MAVIKRAVPWWGLPLNWVVGASVRYLFDAELIFCVFLYQ